MEPGQLLVELLLEAVEDVTFEDITVSKTRQAIRVTMNYSVNNDGAPAPVPPTFRNLRFENIKVPSGGGKGISVIGLPALTSSSTRF